MTKFVEEGDGQPIDDGDYAPFPIDGQRHFVKMRYRGALLDNPYAAGIIPDEQALCGYPVPADWREHPTDFPIAGQVDCARCRQEANDGS